MPHKRMKHSTIPFAFAFLAVASCAANAQISPSRLEANLGILPIDIYSTPQYVDIFPGGTCHTTGGTTPRTCIQQFLASYAAQGARGVRFMFALGDGNWTADFGGPPFNYHSSYSTPFNSSGGINSAWVTNLGTFFSDVAAAGLQRVTPYSVMAYYWAGWQNPTFQQTATVTSCGSSQTLLFFPWLPFGLTPNSNPTSQYAADQGNNQAYNCSAANPYFWGWTPYLNLVGYIASEARVNSLTIDQFSVESEVNLEQFTVTNRLIYDNIAGVDVLYSVGQVLAAQGFPNVATLDIATANPPSPAFDCGSVYGDSAHVLLASELIAGMGGGLIGAPSGISWYGSMACGGTVGSMISVPATSEHPSVTDMHVYPCVEDLPGYVCDAATDITSTANNIYTDIYWFQYYRSLLSNTAMIGETSSNSPPGYGCDGSSTTIATQNVNGYLGSLLYSSHGSNTVLRPWGWITSVSPLLCQTPESIGAPSGPYHP